MVCLGKFAGRAVFCTGRTFDAISAVGQLDNWICFAIASEVYPKDKADAFIRRALMRGILEFRAQGTIR